MFRYSLKTYLLIIGIAALAFAGLASPNELTMRIVATTTLGILLASVITAVAWQNAGRWFWIGFAIAGWSYLAFAVYGGVGANRLLITDFLISRLDAALQTSVPLRPPTGEIVSYRGDGSIRIVTKNRFARWMTVAEAEENGYIKYVYSSFTMPQPMHFYSICHYLISLILGCFGGLLSLRLHRGSPS